MTKRKCPLCQKEVSDLSKHLVLSHNIKDIEHLQTLLKQDTSDDNTILEAPIKTEMESETEVEVNIRTEILKLAIKMRGEPRIRVLEAHIHRMGFLLNMIPDEINIFNEGVDALIHCLYNQEPVVKEWALEELEKILNLINLNGQIEQKIRSKIYSI